MPRVSPPEPKVTDKDRPRCPRCGGVVHKQPSRTYWTGEPDDIPRYTCKTGRKERTCGMYWRQGGSGDLFFDPTGVSHDGLLLFANSPLELLSRRTDGSHHSLEMIVRPKDATGFPEDELLYACPNRPGGDETQPYWVRQLDWGPDFKEFLRQHQDRIVGIPPDVLDGRPHRPWPKPDRAAAHDEVALQEEELG